MSNVPVNTRHQLPHNPNLISHLVHINNPPSRSRGQLRQNHSAFLPPLVRPLIYIRRLKNSGVLRSLGEEEKEKTQKTQTPPPKKAHTLISSCRFFFLKRRWPRSALLSVSVSADSPASRGPPSVTPHLVKKSRRRSGESLSLRAASVGFHGHSADWGPRRAGAASDANKDIGN